MIVIETPPMLTGDTKKDNQLQRQYHYKLASDLPRKINMEIATLEEEITALKAQIKKLQEGD